MGVAAGWSEPGNLERYAGEEVMIDIDPELYTHD
jgi:hypothetical protein